MKRYENFILNEFVSPDSSGRTGEMDSKQMQIPALQTVRLALQELSEFFFLPKRKTGKMLKQVHHDDSSFAKTTKKIIEMPSVGIIHLCKHKKAKNFNIIIRPYRPVRLTVPYKISFSRAEKFLNSKKGWLKTNVAKIRQLENKNQLSEEEIEILRFKAKSYLPFRVDELSQKYNFKYGRVFVKNLRSRWGSCSAKNNINLNLHLMRLPLELIVYVILHELAHTREKNHGAGFYSLLQRIMPNFQEFEKELKKRSIFY